MQRALLNMLAQHQWMLIVDRIMCGISVGFSVQVSRDGEALPDLQGQPPIHRPTQLLEPHLYVSLNKFVNLTNDEYRSKYLGVRDGQRKLKVSKHSDRYALRIGDSFPDSIDWRKKGVVAAVKDQGGSRHAIEQGGRRISCQ
ncbi:Probable cysteine protease RD21B [Linum perenne]